MADLSIADRKGRVIRMDINLNGKMILAGAALLLVFVVIMRKPMIVDPIARFLSKLFLN